MHNYSREWWIDKVAEGMRNDYRAPEPEPERPQRAGTARVDTPCFWDQDATLGTPMCLKCSDCKEHYR